MMKDGAANEVQKLAFEELLAGFERTSLDDGTAFWKSEACLEKLERSLVAKACLDRWAVLAPFPHDKADWHDQMRTCRQFYLQLLQRGNLDTLHTSWAKACCLLDVTVAALLKAGSPLLEDLPLVGAAVLGISRKDETSSATGCWRDLQLVATMLEEELDLDPVEREAKDLINAEIDILVVLDWALPPSDTYQCISVLLLRCDVLTRSAYKPQLEAAWQSAVQRCVRLILHGCADGYSSAYGIVRDALHEVAGFEAAFVEKLLAEAAPRPAREQ